MSLNKTSPDPAIQHFIKEVNDVCRLHGYEFRPILQITPNGIFPSLSIVKTEVKNIIEGVKQ